MFSFTLHNIFKVLITPFVFWKGANLRFKFREEKLYQSSQRNQNLTHYKITVEMDTWIGTYEITKLYLDCSSKGYESYAYPI